MAIVYRHIRLDKNEPFYIGIGKTEKRAYDKNDRNKIWNNIINKTDYEIEILFDNITWEQACIKEQEFINLYGRIDKKNGTLCNLTNGGEGQNGIIRNEEYRLKIKQNALKRWENEAFKEKMKKVLKGRKLPPTSEETKLKLSLISKGRIGKPCSEETKQKLRLHNLGKKHSNETKLKCKNKSLEMWSDKNKAIEIISLMKGTQKRAKIKRNDIKKSD
jgi:hypothetical protein